MIFGGFVCLVAAAYLMAKIAKIESSGGVIWIIVLLVIAGLVLLEKACPDVG